MSSRGASGASASGSRRRIFEAILQRGRPLGCTYKYRDDGFVKGGSNPIFVASVAESGQAAGFGVAVGDKLLAAGDRFVVSVVPGKAPLTMEELLLLEAHWFGPGSTTGAVASEVGPNLVYKFARTRELPVALDVSRGRSLPVVSGGSEILPGWESTDTTSSIITAARGGGLVAANGHGAPSATGGPLPVAQPQVILVEALVADSAQSLEVQSESGDSPAAQVQVVAGDLDSLPPSTQLSPSGLLGDRIPIVHPQAEDHHHDDAAASMHPQATTSSLAVSGYLFGPGTQNTFKLSHSGTPHQAGLPLNFGRRWECEPATSDETSPYTALQAGSSEPSRAAAAASADLLLRWSGNRMDDATYNSLAASARIMGTPVAADSLAEQLWAALAELVPEAVVPVRLPWLASTIVGPIASASSMAEFTTAAGGAGAVLPASDAAASGVSLKNDDSATDLSIVVPHIDLSIVGGASGRSCAYSVMALRLAYELGSPLVDQRTWVLVVKHLRKHFGRDLFQQWLATLYRIDDGSGASGRFAVDGSGRSPQSHPAESPLCTAPNSPPGARLSVRVKLTAASSAKYRDSPVVRCRFLLVENDDWLAQPKVSTEHSRLLAAVRLLPLVPTTEAAMFSSVHVGGLGAFDLHANTSLLALKAQTAQSRIAELEVESSDRTVLLHAAMADARGHDTRLRCLQARLDELEGRYYAVLIDKEDALRELGAARSELLDASDALMRAQGCASESAVDAGAAHAATAMQIAVAEDAKRAVLEAEAKAGELAARVVALEALLDDRDAQIERQRSIAVESSQQAEQLKTAMVALAADLGDAQRAHAALNTQLLEAAAAAADANTAAFASANDCDERLQRAAAAHATAVASIRAEHEAYSLKLNDAYNSKTAELAALHVRTLDSLREEHEAENVRLSASHSEQMLAVSRQLQLERERREGVDSEVFSLSAQLQTSREKDTAVTASVAASTQLAQALVAKAREEARVSEAEKLLAQEASFSAAEEKQKIVYDTAINALSTEHESMRAHLQAAHELAMAELATASTAALDAAAADFLRKSTETGDVFEQQLIQLRSNLAHAEDRIARLQSEFSARERAERTQHEDELTFVQCQHEARMAAAAADAVKNSAQAAADFDRQLDVIRETSAAALEHMRSQHAAEVVGLAIDLDTLVSERDDSHSRAAQLEAQFKSASAAAEADKEAVTDILQRKHELHLADVHDATTARAAALAEEYAAASAALLSQVETLNSQLKAANAAKAVLSRILASHTVAQKLATPDPDGAAILARHAAELAELPRWASQLVAVRSDLADLKVAVADTLSLLTSDSTAAVQQVANFSASSLRALRSLLDSQHGITSEATSLVCSVRRDAESRIAAVTASSAAEVQAAVSRERESASITVLGLHRIINDNAEAFELRLAADAARAQRNRQAYEAQLMHESDFCVPNSPKQCKDSVDAVAPAIETAVNFVGPLALGIQGDYADKVGNERFVSVGRLNAMPLLEIPVPSEQPASSKPFHDIVDGNQPALALRLRRGPLNLGIGMDAPLLIDSRGCESCSQDSTASLDENVSVASLSSSIHSDGHSSTLSVENLAQSVGSCVFGAFSAVGSSFLLAPVHAVSSLFAGAVGRHQVASANGVNDIAGTSRPAALKRRLEQCAEVLPAIHAHTEYPEALLVAASIPWLAPTLHQAHILFAPGYATDAVGVSRSQPRLRRMSYAATTGTLDESVNAKADAEIYRAKYISWYFGKVESVGGMRNHEDSFGLIYETLVEACADGHTLGLCLAPPATTGHEFVHVAAFSIGADGASPPAATRGILQPGDLVLAVGSSVVHGMSVDAVHGILDGVSRPVLLTMFRVRCVEESSRATACAHASVAGPKSLDISSVSPRRGSATDLGHSSSTLNNQWGLTGQRRGSIPRGNVSRFREERSRGANVNMLLTSYKKACQWVRQRAITVSEPVNRSNNTVNTSHNSVSGPIQPTAAACEKSVDLERQPSEVETTVPATVACMDSNTTPAENCIVLTSTPPSPREMTVRSIGSKYGEDAAVTLPIIIVVPSIAVGERMRMVVEVLAHSADSSTGTTNYAPAVTPVVRSIESDSCAYGKLQVGDLLLTVNGKGLTNMHRREVVRLLDNARNSGANITFSVLRRTAAVRDDERTKCSVPVTAPSLRVVAHHDRASILPPSAECVAVPVQVPSDGKLGVTFSGARVPVLPHVPPRKCLLVQEVSPDSVCCGSLHKGDIVTAVNGIDCTNLPHRSSIGLVKLAVQTAAVSSGALVFSVLRRAAPLAQVPTPRRATVFALGSTDVSGARKVPSQIETLIRVSGPSGSASSLFDPGVIPSVSADDVPAPALPASGGDPLPLVVPAAKFFAPLSTKFMSIQGAIEVDVCMPVPATGVSLQIRFTSMPIQMAVTIRPVWCLFVADITGMKRSPLASSKLLRQGDLVLFVEGKRIVSLPPCEAMMAVEHAVAVAQLNASPVIVFKVFRGPPFSGVPDFSLSRSYALVSEAKVLCSRLSDPSSEAAPILDGICGTAVHPITEAGIADVAVVGDATSEVDHSSPIFIATDKPEGASFPGPVTGSENITGNVGMMVAVDEVVHRGGADSEQHRHLQASVPCRLIVDVDLEADSPLPAQQGKGTVLSNNTTSPAQQNLVSASSPAFSGKQSWHVIRLAEDSNALLKMPSDYPVAETSFDFGPTSSATALAFQPSVSLCSSQMTEALPIAGVRVVTVLKDLSAPYFGIALWPRSESDGTLIIVSLDTDHAIASGARINDAILDICGVSTAGMNLPDAYACLKRSGDSITLSLQASTGLQGESAAQYSRTNHALSIQRVHRRLVANNSSRDAKVKLATLSVPRTIILARGGGKLRKLGISLLPRSDDDQTAIVVGIDSVTAIICGICINDAIVAINGVATSGASFEEIGRRLQSAGNSVSLSVVETTGLIGAAAVRHLLLRRVANCTLPAGASDAHASERLAARVSSTRAGVTAVCNASATLTRFFRSIIDFWHARGRHTLLAMSKVQASAIAAAEAAAATARFASIAEAAAVVERALSTAATLESSISPDSETESLPRSPVEPEPASFPAFPGGWLEPLWYAVRFNVTLRRDAVTGALGVRLGPCKDGAGLRVLEVKARPDAATSAGLQANDVIVAVGSTSLVGLPLHLALAEVDGAIDPIVVSVSGQRLGIETRFYTSEYAGAEGDSESTDTATDASRANAASASLLARPAEAAHTMAIPLCEAARLACASLDATLPDFSSTAASAGSVAVAPMLPSMAQLLERSIRTDTTRFEWEISLPRAAATADLAPLESAAPDCLGLLLDDAPLLQIFASLPVVIVSGVVSGSVVHTSGSIAPGDAIVGVNGRCTVGLCAATVRRAIRVAPGPTVVLRIRSVTLAAASGVVAPVGNAIPRDVFPHISALLEIEAHIDGSVLPVGQESPGRLLPPGCVEVVVSWQELAALEIAHVYFNKDLDAVGNVLTKVPELGPLSVFQAGDEIVSVFGCDVQHVPTFRLSRLLACRGKIGAVHNSPSYGQFAVLVRIYRRSMCSSRSSLRSAVKVSVDGPPIILRSPVAEHESPGRGGAASDLLHVPSAVNCSCPMHAYGIVSELPPQGTAASRDALGTVDAHFATVPLASLACGAPEADLVVSASVAQTRAFSLLLRYSSPTALRIAVLAVYEYLCVQTHGVADELPASESCACVLLQPVCGATRRALSSARAMRPFESFLSLLEEWLLTHAAAKRHGVSLGAMRAEGHPPLAAPLRILWPDFLRFFVEYDRAVGTIELCWLLATLFPPGGGDGNGATSPWEAELQLCCAMDADDASASLLGAPLGSASDTSTRLAISAQTGLEFEPPRVFQACLTAAKRIAHDQEEQQQQRARAAALPRARRGSLIRADALAAAARASLAACRGSDRWYLLYVHARRALVRTLCSGAHANGLHFLGRGLAAGAAFRGGEANLPLSRPALQQKTVASVLTAHVAVLPGTLPRFGEFCAARTQCEESPLPASRELDVGAAAGSTDTCGGHGPPSPSRATHGGFDALGLVHLINPLNAVGVAAAGLTSLAESIVIHTSAVERPLKV